MPWWIVLFIGMGVASVAWGLAFVAAGAAGRSGEESVGQGGVLQIVAGVLTFAVVGLLYLGRWAL